MVLLDVAAVIFYLQLRPHTTRFRMIMEVTNEVGQMFLYYLMILFSRKTTDVATRFSYGYSFLVLIVLIMLANIIPAMVDSVFLFIANRKMKAKEKALEALSEDMKRRLEEQRDAAKAPLAIRQRMLDEL